MKNSLVAPLTNRGVENTLNPYFSMKKQYILFDWLQFTITCDSLIYYDDFGCSNGFVDFKDFSIKLFKEFFNIDFCDLFFEYKGINGYNCSLSYKNIFCYWHTSRSDMGINFKISGQGCRDLDDLSIDYSLLFRSISRYSFHFNRIDVAIDDFTDDYFTLDTLLTYVKLNSVSSKFKSTLNIEKISLSDSSFCGHSLQFGSKASNVQVTFYDKRGERISNGYTVDSSISFWTRTEIRFRHELADSVISTFLDNSIDFTLYIKSILYNYIDFKNLCDDDKNFSRRVTARFWLDFLDNVSSLSFSILLPESSISKKSKWLKDSVSKTNFMVYLSQLDNLSTDDITNDYLLKLLNFGVDKFTFKDLVIINDYRVSNNLIPFDYSQILDYIQDIKDLVNELENSSSSDNI